MKKSTFYASLASAMLLGACNSLDNNEYTESYSTGMVNIVTDLSTGTSVFSDVVYSSQVDYTNATATLSASNLVINNGSYTLNSDPTKYSADGYNVLVNNFVGYLTGNMTLPVTNGFFGLYSYYGNSSYAGEYNFNPSNTPAMVTYYTAGSDYRIHSIKKNPVYAGETTTTYPYNGVVETFTTTDIQYGVYFNTTKNEAVIVMFNAKFSSSPMEPKKAAIILEGLTMECDGSTLTIYGENVVPGVVDGSATTPNPSYTFDSIKLVSTNESMTNAKIDYEVAGVYQGSFTGSYVITF